MIGAQSQVLNVFMLRRLDLVMTKAIVEVDKYLLYAVTSGGV